MADILRSCAVLNCKRPYRAKGYCATHYRRLMVHGSPDTLVNKTMSPNDRYNQLVAIESVGSRKWRFLCDCGQETIAYASNVTRGNTTSCGCVLFKFLRRPGPRNFKHGMTNTPTWNSWCAMWDRCTNASHPKFSNYGGRGITICDHWDKFENFYADMGKRPDGMTLDRHPNKDGNYELGNCRWATASQQNINRRPRNHASSLDASPSESKTGS